MKKFFKSYLFVAAIAMAFVGCSKDDTTDISVATGKQIEMTIIAGGDIENAPESKTLIDEKNLQMKWSETGEELKVLQVADGEIAAESTTEYTPSADFRTATFKVSFAENTTAASFGYSAVYPAVNWVDNKNTAPAKFKVELPTAQTPAADSFDPNADLLLAKYQTSETQLTETHFQFHRIAAMAKMTVKGITAGENITKVEFSTPKKVLSGRSYVDLTTSTVTEIGYSGQAFHNVDLTFENRTATGEDAIWFTCYPCTLSGADGDTFTVTVTTDVAQYTKIVTLAAGKEIVFESANLTRFSVNNLERTQSATDEYVLLTDAADLGVGDKIIITDATTDGACKALGTKQNSNNRAAADITITDSKITTIPADVQIIEIENGTQAGTFAMKVDNGYLSATTEDNNRLHTDSNITDVSSWYITIDNNSVATIKAKKEGHNWLRYNSGSHLFSCYESGQSPVYIFYKPDTAPRIEIASADIAPANSIDGLYELAYTLKNIDAAETIKAVGDGTVVKADAAASNGEIVYELNPNYSNEIRQGSITLSLESNPAVSATVTIQQAGSTFEVTTPDTPNEITIPAAAETATFTVLSKEFAWEATSDNANITLAPASGSADETEATVTVSSNAATTDAEQTLGTITVKRDGETTGVTITVKKAAAGTKIDLHAPTVTIDEGSVSTTGFMATWDNVSGAGSYPWKLLSEQTDDVDNADANIVVKSNIASIDDGGIAETDLTLTAGATYYLYVKSVAADTNTHNDSAWTEAVVEVPAAEKTITIDLTAQGYGNAANVTTVNDASGIVLTFSNAKYYDSGTSVRVYSGGTLTVSGKTITNIKFTISSGKSEKITANSGTYTAPEWTGKAESVTFTNTDGGQIRFQKVTVTYTE